MSTVITEVQGTNIAPITLIDLTIDTTTYHISSHYIPVTIGTGPSAITYNELGNFLNVNEIVDDLKYNTADLQVTLSGIPSNQEYVGIILAHPVSINATIDMNGHLCLEHWLIFKEMCLRGHGLLTTQMLTDQDFLIEQTSGTQ